jgi:hypothetical protein
MGEAEALLVPTVGVAPERVPGAVAARALDLQMPRGADLSLAALFGLAIEWARQDSNLDLTDYESAALTD